MTNTSLYDNPTFQHILTTTEEIILEKGCRHTTLKDIIERTGLSKGAIYHYVDSKDELFGLILQAKVLNVNEDFETTVAAALKSEQDHSPFAMVSKNFAQRQDSNDVTNLIFVYLLSQDNEKVTQILNNVYQYGKETGLQWLGAGQERGVIPASINIEEMAEYFMVFSYGLRMKQILAPNEEKIDAKDIYKLLIKSLT